MRRCLIYIAVLILSFSLSIAFSAEPIQGPRLIKQSRNLHENIVIQSLFDNFRAPRSRLKAHVFQPSRTHCNLHAFWLLSGSLDFSRISSDRPFVFHENHESGVIYTLFENFQALWFPLKSLLASHSWRGPSDPTFTKTLYSICFVTTFWISGPLSKYLSISFEFLPIDGTCFSKIMKMLCDFWANMAPRAGETLENTRSFVRVGGPKERPRETQNLATS